MVGGLCCKSDTTKRSSRTPRPGFSLFECYRQKISLIFSKHRVYWSSSWARILNVKDIIKERTKETSSNISWTYIPPATIAGAGHHSLINTCLRCTSYRGCRPTHQILVQCWASVAAHCWFNACQSSMTLVQH